MAGVLRRVLKVSPSRPLLELEADWSAISPSGLGLVFKELLADFMGAPPPPDVLEAREFYRRAWKTANVSDIYFQQTEKKNQGRSFTDTSGAKAKTTASKKGLVSWFTDLKEGTLHVEEDHEARMRRLFPKGHVHFSVTDMVELKWVIEDLNGVSYRKSTLGSGFQDLGVGAKQL